MAKDCRVPSQGEYTAISLDASPELERDLNRFGREMHRYFNDAGPFITFAYKTPTRFRRPTSQEVVLNDTLVDVLCALRLQRSIAGFLTRQHVIAGQATGGVPSSALAMTIAFGGGDTVEAMYDIDNAGMVALQTGIRAGIAPTWLCTNYNFCNWEASPEYVKERLENLRKTMKPSGTPEPSGIRARLEGMLESR